MMTDYRILGAAVRLAGIAFGSSADAGSGEGCDNGVPVGGTECANQGESIGADVVRPLTDGWRDAALAATGGRGADLVVDPVGGDAFDDAIRVLAPEGRLLVLGFAAGQGIPSVKVNRMLLRNISVVGVGYGEFIRQVPGSAAEIGAGLAKLVEAGLRPPEPVRFPLSDGAAALQALADGKIHGQAVLKP